MKYLRKFVVVTTLSSLLSTQLFAQASAGNVALDHFVLPKDIKEPPQNPGAIFYSPTSKNKPLMPVNFWGEVKNSGLHYIPTDSNLIKGLSLAGGPLGSSDLSEVKVTRTKNDGKLESYNFSLDKGGEAKSFQFELRPGDTVFIPKDTFESNRAYYTSLFGVFATILSSVLLYREVKK